jgi:hypothetical protein
MSTKNNYSELLSLLKERFESNMNRHKDLKLEEIQIKL